MVCPYCGENVGDGSEFCLKCGSPFASTTAPGGLSAAGMPGPFPGGPFPGASLQPVTPHASGMAIGSLICGIFFFFFPAAGMAVVLGHLSLLEVKKSAGRLTGRGMAITGLVLGYLGLAFIPILIIAAIAIPNVKRFGVTGNEASAVGALKSYSYALSTYASDCPKNGFPRSLENLGFGEGARHDKCAHDGLLDNSLGIANPVKSGYRFEYVPGLPNESGQITNFQLFARPVAPGQTGIRYYFVDETTVIRFSHNSVVNEDSQELEPSK